MEQNIKEVSSIGHSAKQRCNQRRYAKKSAALGIRLNSVVTKDVKQIRFDT